MKRETRQRITHHLFEHLEQRVMLSVPATPLQSVTSSADTDGVHFSVLDPLRNTRQNGFEPLGTGETASTVLSGNGIVAFSKSWRDSFLAVHTDVFYEVYDVQKGAWQEGHQELATGEVIGNLSTSGGVVCWSATSLDYYNAPNVRVFFAVYDPLKGAWQNERQDMAAGEAVTAVQNSGGVVAWSASSRDVNNALQQRVFFEVYDPQRGHWQDGKEVLATGEAAGTITITNCTVSWTSNVAAYTRGYDPGVGAWNNQTSKPLAFFYGGSLIGTPPLTLYLWDMSIGATSWSWDFGDGSAANTTQAPSYTYNSENIFTLTQTATNSGVSSTATATVNTHLLASTDFALSNNSIVENQPTGTMVGTFSSINAATGDTFTYNLVSGAGSTDNDSFTIADNTLQTAKLLTYGTRNSYSIRVRSTDQSGLWFEKVFTINVTNVNEAPAKIDLSNSTVTQHQPPGTAVGTLSTTDPDPGNTFTYSLVTDDHGGGADNGSFTISGNTLLALASFDLASKSSYSILVRSTDQDGLSDDQAFTISVTDKTPTEFALSNNTIAEHLPLGSIVGTFGTADAVGGGRPTFSLVDGSGSDDNSSFRISGNRLYTKRSFDFRTQNSYSIRVRVTDKTGLNSEAVFTINVLNMLDLSWKSMSVKPTSLTTFGGTISVKRNYRISGRPADSDFGIQYHLSTDQIWGNADDIVLGDGETISTKGGKSVSTHAKTVKLNVGRLAAGSYFLLADLDPANTVSEKDETNNVITAPLKITAPMFGWVNGVHQVLKITDADGDLLKFSLTGTGTGELTGANLDLLTLTRTSMNTVVKITITKSGSGDGQMTLSGIASDGPMKRIAAPGVGVNGEVNVNTLLATPSPTGTPSVSLGNISSGQMIIDGVPVSWP